MLRVCLLSCKRLNSSLTFTIISFLFLWCFVVVGFWILSSGMALNSGKLMLHLLEDCDYRREPPHSSNATILILPKQIARICKSLKGLQKARWGTHSNLWLLLYETQKHLNDFVCFHTMGLLIDDYKNLKFTEVSFSVWIL